MQLHHPSANPPRDTRALIAIDLGAESCRVSLLRWIDRKPQIQMVHRFANSALQTGQGLRWDLSAICRELTVGLKHCAAMAGEGIAAIAVDGWSVDYARLNSSAQPMYQPFCYRDERTVEIEKTVHEKLDRDRLYRLTGTRAAAHQHAVSAAGGPERRGGSPERMGDAPRIHPALARRRARCRVDQCHPHGTGATGNRAMVRRAVFRVESPAGNRAPAGSTRYGGGAGCWDRWRICRRLPTRN